MLSQYEENLKNERIEKGQLSEDYENRIQMLNSVRAIIQVLFSAYHRYHCERFESRSHLISRLNLTVQVRLVLNRNVVDSDCQWLWRWLPHRLSKRHCQQHALPTHRYRYHYLRVIIPEFTINDPPCNSVMLQKGWINDRYLFIYLFMIWNFFLQQVQDLKKALDSQKVSYNEHKYDDDDDTSHGGMMMVMMLTQWWWW